VIYRTLLAVYKSFAVGEHFCKTRLPHQNVPSSPVQRVGVISALQEQSHGKSAPPASLPVSVMHIETLSILAMLSVVILGVLRMIFED
jgi:hypothetical protein